MDESKNKTVKRLIKIGSIFFISSIFFAFIFYIYAPNDQKRTGALTILSIGIMLGAFIPQLLQNQSLKGQATDPVLAIFLILTACGVLLRIPGLRQQLHIINKNKEGLLLVLLITFSNLVPLIAHTLWQWQGAIYDTHKAIIAKDILKISAPITTIIVVISIYWLFSVVK